ncbi:TerD family protein [Actinocorallia longicatena]|uniref:TerD domain-containing protein n=1 Tax=Actinocorallia longicatena TaxID=111803 RepID=A0ABP6Q2P1_9ACTN
MAELVRGANAPLSATRVTVTCACAAPADLSALLVGRDMKARTDDDLVFYNAPAAGGVTWTAEAVTVDLTAVPADVHAVVITLSLDQGTFGGLTPPSVRVEEHSFTADRLGPESAIVALEIYRRDSAWKVRAVGQGYAGGLAELLADHGVQVDEPAAEPAPVMPELPRTVHPPDLPPPPPPPPPPPTAVPSGARELAYADRVWMVWEDASRSLESYRSSVQHALTIRDDEVAGRAVPGRSQQVMTAAAERMHADMSQLAGELAEHEGRVGAELAPFSSASWLTWGPLTELGPGLLLGDLTAEETPALQIPLVLRLPWRRPIWINEGAAPRDPIAYAWSLVTRFFAAVPPGSSALEIIDPSGLSGCGWVNSLPHPLAGAGVAHGSAVGPRLDHLLNLIDLRSVGGEDGPLLAGAPPVRLVVLFDVGAAIEQHGDKILRLVDEGPAAGVPVICVNNETFTGESVRALRIRQASHTLPSTPGTLSDAWVGGDWTLVPDVLPDGGALQAPSLLQHVLSAHARAIERA